MSTITTEQWLTTEELAAELKVAAETVRDWRKRGTGPRGTKIGHAVRYSRSDIAAWIAQTNGIPAGH
jgi:excisionase family DNA binding protein